MGTARGSSEFEDDLSDLLDMLDYDHEKDVRKAIKGIIPLCGSKTRLAVDIVDRFPACDIFVDLFGGSGCITLNCKIAKKLHVYNDAYSGVVDFYRCLINHKEELARTLASFPPQSREYWEVCRKEYITEKDHIIRAAKWYYWLANSVQIRGTCFARRVQASFQDPLASFKGFDVIHRRMRNVQIENLDFRQCFKDFDNPNTVIYCDPPYLGTSAVYQNRWTENDLVDLLKMIRVSRADVFLSHSPHPIVESCDFLEHVKTWEVQKHSDVESANRAGLWTECLWKKKW